MTVMLDSPKAALDIQAVRRYLAGVRALAAEGERSNSPRVIIDVLRILRRQRETIDGLFRV